MNGDSDTAWAKFVNSVALTVVARGVMIFGTTVGLPVGFWLMSRAVDSFDKISGKVDTIREQSIETNGNVKMIQQTQTQQTQIIIDHETRVRALENLSRSLRPVPP